MAAEEEVKLYGMWASPYSRRIELALKLKGTPYQYFEEDLYNKSPSLVKYNPVHQKVPVLVHNGKPISESLVILDYIDDTWKNNPLLPQDSYERAKARFWARFIDEKILPTAQKAIYLEGKQREVVTEEVCEQMKLLEKELDGKNFFGGDGIRFVDIVGNVVAFWFRMTRELLGVEVCSPEKFPGLSRWIGNLQEIDVVNECMPPVEKHLAYVRARIEAIKYARE